MVEVLKIKNGNAWQSVPALVGPPGQGVPTGGTSGQILKKNSNTNYDTVWANQNEVSNVSGTTPSITGVAGTRYVCGEVSTISITPPDSGIIDVIFVSGSTPAVLTVPSTVKWNDDSFDPESLEADTVYELNILDGIYGAVGTWTD